MSFGAEGMWDDEFSKTKGTKKFELGRVIEREPPKRLAGDGATALDQMSTQLQDLSI